MQSYKGFIASVGHKSGLRNHEVDDLLSVIFTELSTGALKDYDKQKGHFRQWLSRRSGWRALEIIKRRLRVEQRAFSLEDPEALANSEVCVESMNDAFHRREEAINFLKGAMNRAGLTDREKQVILCRYLQGMSPSEIMELGYSRAQVDMAHNHAKRKLTDLFERSGLDSYRTLLAAL